jgi:hypothetical protein
MQNQDQRLLSTIAFKAHLVLDTQNPLCGTEAVARRSHILTENSVAGRCAELQPYRYPNFEFSYRSLSGIDSSCFSGVG